jgi:hypothetical protein
MPVLVHHARGGSTRPHAKALLYLRLLFEAQGLLTHKSASRAAGMEVWGMDTPAAGVAGSPVAVVREGLPKAGAKGELQAIEVKMEMNSVLFYVPNTYLMPVWSWVFDQYRM